MSKVLFLVSPTLNSFVDPRKGTTGNKIDCAMHHFGNSLVSNVQIGAAAGITALAGRAVVKKTPELAAKVAEMGGVKKFFQYLKAAPKPLKVIAGVAAGLSLLYRTYKKGTIEQKYLDRAQFVDHTFTLDKKEKTASASIKA